MLGVIRNSYKDNLYKILNLLYINIIKYLWQLLDNKKNQILNKKNA